MTMIHYFKNYQGNHTWQYYKVITDRNPPGCEIVNFLNQYPLVQFREYNLRDPESREEYNAFWIHAEHITEEEYQAAYQRATAVPFNLLINGQWLGHATDVATTNGSGVSGRTSVLVRCYQWLVILLSWIRR